MILRRLFIWLIAAAFVFNGAAALAFIEVPATLAPISEKHHVGAASSDHGVRSAPHHGDTVVTMQGQDQTHQHVDDCLKCCEMCNVASMAPESLKAPVRFSYAGISFRTGHDDLPGRFVGLDPGIPKSAS